MVDNAISKKEYVSSLLHLERTSELRNWKSKGILLRSMHTTKCCSLKSLAWCMNLDMWVRWAITRGTHPSANRRRKIKKKRSTRLSKSKRRRSRDKRKKKRRKKSCTWSNKKNLKSLKRKENLMKKRKSRKERNRERLFKRRLRRSRKKG